MIATKTSKVRSPLKRHGGKHYLAKRIVALMPEHRTYVEPFVGGGSVLLTKPKAEREIAGDLDAGLIGFWRVLSKAPMALKALADCVTYSEKEFGNAAEDVKEYPPSCARGAVAYIVRNRFSRGGLGKTYAWSDRLRGGQPEQLNSWDTIRAELPEIARRVGDVEFHCVDAISLIRQHDSPDTLHYLDPPYCHGTRTAKSAYEHEMTDAQHGELLDAIQQCKGVVMLSGYANPMYDDRLTGWNRVSWELPNNSGQGKTKQRRTEVLWVNRWDGGARS